MNEYFSYPCLLQVKDMYMDVGVHQVLVFFDAPGVGRLVYGDTGSMVVGPHGGDPVGLIRHDWDMELFETYEPKF